MLKLHNSYFLKIFFDFFKWRSENLVSRKLDKLKTNDRKEFSFFFFVEKKISSFGNILLMRSHGKTNFANPKHN